MIAIPYLLSRTLIVSIFVCARSTIFIQDPATVIYNMNPELRLTWTKIVESLSLVVLQGDVNWYLSLAANGYAGPPFTPTVQQNWCFFPVWASVLWTLKVLTGHPLLFGFFVANIIFAISLYFIVRICERDNLSSQTISTIIWLLCFFPTSYFFAIPMTESLFLLLTAASMLLLNSDRVIFSGLLFGIASATRPTGLLLLPAYWISLIGRRSVKPNLKPLGAGLAASGLLAFSAYLWLHLNEPFAYITGLTAWERGQKSIIDLIVEIAHDPLLVLKPWSFIWLNIAAALLSLAAAVYWWRVRRYEYLLYCLVPTVSALLTGSVLSISRSTLLLFPVFIALGIWAKTRERELALLTIFATLLAIMCVMFARGANTAMT